MAGVFSCGKGDTHFTCFQMLVTFLKRINVIFFFNTSSGDGERRTGRDPEREVSRADTAAKSIIRAPALLSSRCRHEGKVPRSI